MRRHAVHATHFLNLESPRLEELALLVVAAQLRDLQPALEHRSTLSPVGAAMSPLPLVPRILGRLGR